jgi:hypothetical protein
MHPSTAHILTLGANVGVMATTGRPVINVALDEDTRDQLRAFAGMYGVTVAGLIEAFVRCLPITEPPAQFLLGMPPWVIEVVTTARTVDAERRAR